MEMKIGYIEVMEKIYKILNEDTELKQIIGNGQIIDQLQVMKPPYPIIIVNFPVKESEPHISIGYSPRPQLSVPVEVRVWQRTAEGVDRSLKEMAEELYAIVDRIEEIIRNNPRLDDEEKFIKVLPESVGAPVLEIGDGYQVLRVMMTISVDMKI